MINLNLEVFKEPKGFIKLIQILFIIITLASICSFHGSSSISVQHQINNVTSTDKFDVKVYYPFKLNDQKISFKISVNTSLDLYMKGDFESSSQYAVFIAVVSMIYCIAALVIYLVFNDFIYQDPKIRKADFVIEAVLTFLWFVVAIAWSDVVSKLKYSSAPQTLCAQVTGPPILGCEPGPAIPFGGAYIGIIAGFTTFGLMLCGLWFLWKETTWFQKPPADVYSPNETPQGDTGQDGRPYY